MDTIFRARNQRIQWNIDPDGLLRFKGTVLKSGLLRYDLEELKGVGVKGIPPNVLEKGFAILYIPPEEIANQESIQSLEGRPVQLDHSWCEAGDDNSVGAVAGTPYFCDDTKLLYSDALINDPATIRRITSIDNDSKLVDISAGYRTRTIWKPGYTDDGEYYDGIQRDIKYNHIILCHEGEGRCGKEVRIINRKQGVESMSFTTMKIGNSKIRVHDEDVDRLQSEIDSRDVKITNSIDPSKFDKAVNQLDSLKADINALTCERDSMKGELATVKDQLSNEGSPEVMGDRIADAIVEQDEATDILDAFNADGLDDDSSDDTATNKCGARTINRKYFGHNLRLRVVNSVRKSRGQSLLEDSVSNNEDIVKGMFKGLKESAMMVKNSRSSVNGADVMTVTNKKAMAQDDKQVDFNDVNPADAWRKNQISWRYKKHGSVIPEEYLGA